MPFKKDPNEIGVLWMKTNAKGHWFSGTINGTAVVVFATNSTNPKAPTHRVLIAQKKEDMAPATQLDEDF